MTRPEALSELKSLSRHANIRLETWGGNTPTGVAPRGKASQEQVTKAPRGQAFTTSSAQAMHLTLRALHVCLCECQLDWVAAVASRGVISICL